MEILLIEDNSGDILLIETTIDELEEIEANIITKTNGLDASYYINETEKLPDLVILDLNLPYKNGFEILSEIRESEYFGNVPVVIFTSSSNEEDLTRALEMGAKAYIIKPIDFDEYKNTVKYFLSFASR